MPESGRLEQILRSVDHFKPMTTRRSFMATCSRRLRELRVTPVRVSTVYAIAGDAVNALVGLGLSPSA